MAPVKVEVEYSGGFRCTPQFKEMETEVKKQFQETDILFEGNVGRDSAFEVSINGELVFSKLNQCGFPHVDDVVGSIRAAQKGEVQKITRSQSGCTIL